MLLPGTHVIVIGQDEDAIRTRKQGLCLRDTVLILLPGPKEVFAFLFRKPLEGTVAQNVIKHGVGGLWIDGCRIATQDSLNGGAYCGERREKTTEWQNADRSGGKGSGFRQGLGEFKRPPGRWPTNLVLVHGPGCVREGEKELRTHWGQPHAGKGERIGVKQASGWGTKKLGGCVGYADPKGFETVTSWQCQPDCPVGLLDGQSLERGIHSAGNKSMSCAAPFSNLGGTGLKGQMKNPDFHHDSGGASRFYPQFASFPKALEWLTQLIGKR
jgi:hypothetical protein